LVARNVFAMQIACGKDDEDRGDDASSDADFEKYASITSVRLEVE
jgi:cation transport regulator ChaB